MSSADQHGLENTQNWVSVGDGSVTWQQWVTQGRTRNCKASL